MQFAFTCYVPAIFSTKVIDKMSHQMTRIKFFFAAIACVASAQLAYAAGTETTAADNDLSPDYTAGKAAVEKKNWALAAKHFEAAVKADPKSADAHNMLGYSYRWQGKYKEAFASYDRAFAIDPNHKGAHEYVGVAYLKQNNVAKAQYHLAQLERICGKKCEGYDDLAKAIAAHKPAK